MGSIGISETFCVRFATSNSFLKYSTVLWIPSLNGTYSDISKGVIILSAR